MSLVLSAVSLRSFTAKCSLFSPDLVRSIVMFAPSLCFFRCLSPFLTISHRRSPSLTVSRSLEYPEARLRLIFLMVAAVSPPEPPELPDLCPCSWSLSIAFTAVCSSLSVLSEASGSKDISSWYDLYPLLSSSLYLGVACTQDLKISNGVVNRLWWISESFLCSTLADSSLVRRLVDSCYHISSFMEYATWKAHPMSPDSRADSPHLESRWFVGATYQLDCVCLGIRCYGYSFMEVFVLSISPLRWKCFVARLKSFFVTRLVSSLSGMGWSFYKASEVLLLDGSVLSRKDGCISQKSSLRQCSTSAYVADCLALRKALLDACTGVIEQCFFPIFPLIWSGLDVKDSLVLQGFSSRLMLSSKKLLRSFLCFDFLCFLFLICIFNLSFVLPLFVWTLWHLLPCYLEFDAF